MGASPASGRWRSSSIRDHPPVLRHSAALLEGRSGAAALLGSSRAMVPRVLSAVDGRMKTIALPQHEKARRPRGRRRCVGPNLARLGHRRGAEGAHVHAHDDCCKRCAAAIGRKIFPRIIECGAASRGGYSCVRTIHNFLRARQCPESYEARHDGSLFNTAKNVIGWSMRLIVHRSAVQHEKPDAPCRVRRRVGPPRHRHWRA